MSIIDHKTPYSLKFDTDKAAENKKLLKTAFINFFHEDDRLRL
jgi:hypothetical protein